MATNEVSDDPISLICKLCEKSYQHKDGPLMLPCLHSFCKPCLIKYIETENSSNNKMACPSCNNRFPLPDNVTNFPVNLRLSHLAKSTAYEKKAGKGNVKCQKCEGTPKDATVFFCNRSKFLCAKCKGDYQRLFDEEEQLEFIELASFEKGEFKVHSPPPKCPKHPKQELALFCEECKMLICVICAQTKAHKNHDRNSLDETSEKQKAELQEMMGGVVETLETLDQTIQQIQEMREKVKISAEEVTNQINTACDDLIKEVESRRKILQRKCWEIAEGKEDALSNQVVELDHLRSKLNFAQLHAHDAINNQRADEILSVKKAIELQLILTTDLYKKQSLELREDNMIGISLQTEPLVEEIQKFGFFPGVPDPSKCHVEGLVAPQATVGKERQMTVVLEDEMGKPVEGVVYFQYELRKTDVDFDEFIPPKISIAQSNENDGTAIFGFTPEQAGEYEVTIMVRNRPIANPYKVTVKQPRNYSDFQKMEATNKNVGGYCYGVAVHDNGTIYATDYSNNTIKVFKPDGTEGQIGGSDNAGGELSSPWGITILDDKLYVTSNGNHMIKMFSATDGTFIEGFGTGSGGSGNNQFNSPRGICVDAMGRVLVCDNNNKRIQILSSKGEFIKSFSCSNYPYDIAVDTVGNMHVALRDDNHIGIYSRDFSKIDNYNLGGNLRYPTGIYIDGEGNRLIGERDNNRVHIADPTGTLISTRGINNAWGVSMDKNGMIYVAEYSNNRISVY